MERRICLGLKIMKKILGNIAALFFGLIIAFIAGEILARTILPVSTLRSEYDPSVGVRRIPNQKAKYVGEDYSNTVIINSAGYHDFQRSTEKPEDAYRIAIIGDSYIEGLQVSREKNFTHLLEQELNNKQTNGKKFEVLNFGVSGFGIPQYYRTMEAEVMKYNPDLIIMAIYSGNDFYNSIFEFEKDVYKPYYQINDGSIKYISPHPYSNLWLKDLLKKSDLFVFIKQIINTSRPIQLFFSRLGLMTISGGLGSDGIPEEFGVYDPSEPSPWNKAYQTGLEMIKKSSQLAVENNVQFMVVIVPPSFISENKETDALNQYPELSKKVIDWNYPINQIIQFNKKEKIETLDLLPFFKDDYKTENKSFSWLHDGHWNEYGHQKASEFIGSYLNPRLFQK